MKVSSLLLPAVCGVIGILGAACGSTATTASSFSALGGSPPTTCTPDDRSACSCSDGEKGTRTCASDGSGWSICTCAPPDAGEDAPRVGRVCGDGVCVAGETCASCPTDCGDCPICDYAPTCTGVFSVPTNATPLASFNNAGQTMYSSGVGFDPAMPDDATTCSAPVVEMRVSQLVVHKNGSPGSTDLFCIVQADDGTTSQIVVTPEYMNLSDNNPAISLSPADGTFWGQAVSGVKLSQANVHVTYQCFMVTQPTALQKALAAIASYAGEAAAIPGNPYGWAFSVGGAAAAALEAATAVGSGATPLLSVQQTIDKSALLKLTNGYSWVIEETGSTKVDGDCNVFGSCDWDWELDVEAWGCAAPKGVVPM